MAGDGWRAHVEARGDIARGQFLLGEVGEYLAPWHGRQGFENLVGAHFNLESSERFLKTGSLRAGIGNYTDTG
jgi:hypothetical protein